MTTTLFNMIKWPYLTSGLPSLSGRRRKLVPGSLPPNISDHLLRDIGLIEGPEARRYGTEMPLSARDLIDRYR
ncbi:hypothetical protein LMIY3S_05558 [Labrys miyagiensis]